MINILKENYNIEITEYNKYHEGIIFYMNGFNYYLTICYLTEDSLTNIDYFIKKITKIPFHSLIYNNKHKLLSQNYILLRINTIIDEIALNDIYHFHSITLNDYRNNYLFMDELWEQKIDYLEHQLNELSDNKLINNSFDYFVGLSETILKFFRINYSKQSHLLVLSHQTLSSLNTIDFYNPLSISYDYYLKDISSYLRLKGDEQLLLNIIEKLTPNDKCYLFTRMIFPFNYFTEVENILINKKDDSTLITIINNIPKYEEYISRMEKYFGYHIYS